MSGSPIFGPPKSAGSLATFDPAFMPVLEILATKGSSSTPTCKGMFFGGPGLGMVRQDSTNGWAPILGRKRTLAKHESE